MAGKCSDLIGIQAKPCIILSSEIRTSETQDFQVLEYLENGDLVFNSIVGPIRIDFTEAQL